MFVEAAVDKGDALDWHALDATLMIWDLEDLSVPMPSGPDVIALVGDEATARLALARGARGVMHRDAALDRLPECIRAVSAGFRVLDEGLEWDVQRGMLTPRQLEVLALLAEGLGNRAIGRHLDISEHTAKFHTAAILWKLEADNRTQAVVRALRGGLI